jgi:hypothetical protein
MNVHGFPDLELFDHTGFNHPLHRRLAWVNGRFETWFDLTLSPNR